MDADRQKFRINELVRAVRLDGESTGEIVEINEGSIVELCGDAPMPGFVEIAHQGHRSAIFPEDLADRSQRVNSARNSRDPAR